MAISRAIPTVFLSLCLPLTTIACDDGGPSEAEKEAAAKKAAEDKARRCPPQAGHRVECIAAETFGRLSDTAMGLVRNWGGDSRRRQTWNEAFTPA